MHLEKERDFDTCERREKEKKSLLDSINKMFAYSLEILWRWKQILGEGCSRDMLC